MPSNFDIASQVKIKINGTDVQREQMAKLVSVSVDQHTHLPNMFTLRFYDRDMKLLDEGPFDLTKEVEIKAKRNDNEITLIKGEITALEPEFSESMTPELVVRGFDKIHRLYRETKSKSYVNVKDSDIANEIAQAASLQTEVETTSIVYDHVYQNNQSDLVFLMERAWRIGFECYVDDEKLVFRKPPASGSASVTMKYGEDLHEFHPRMTLAEQVDEVIVRGWDIEKQEAIVGKAQSGGLYPSIQETKDGASWAQSFGTGKKIIVDQPVISQSEANSLAEARLNEISGAFIDAEGLATRRPDIKAGEYIQLEGLGKRFSGTYLVTSATHVYSSEGFSTLFRVSGTRTGLISEQILPEKPVDVWPGVGIAVVTNTDDPKDWGRVKVKYPWVSDDTESDWIRCVGMGAGPDCGLFILPDVGDEVLVAFENGSFNHPFVIGGLWNGQNALPPAPAGASSGEKPKVSTWHSRDGHYMVIRDDEKKIEIQTSDGRVITLSDDDKKITLKTSGVEITLEDSKLTIDASGEISIKSQSNLNIEASGQVNIKGQIINLN